jgi:hypothetical protein
LCVICFASCLVFLLTSAESQHFESFSKQASDLLGELFSQQGNGLLVKELGEQANNLLAKS